MARGLICQPPQAGHVQGSGAGETVCGTNGNGPYDNPPALSRLPRRSMSLLELCQPPLSFPLLPPSGPRLHMPTRSNHHRCTPSPSSFSPLAPSGGHFSCHQPFFHSRLPALAPLVHPFLPTQLESAPPWTSLAGRTQVQVEKVALCLLRGGRPFGGHLPGAGSQEDDGGGNLKRSAVASM